MKMQYFISSDTRNQNPVGNMCLKKSKNKFILIFQQRVMKQSQATIAKKNKKNIIIDGIQFSCSQIPK